MLRQEQEETGEKSKKDCLLQISRTTINRISQDDLAAGFQYLTYDTTVTKLAQSNTKIEMLYINLRLRINRKYIVRSS